jgi:cell division septal protein FtsQ
LHRSVRRHQRKKKKKKKSSTSKKKKERKRMKRLDVAVAFVTLVLLAMCITGFVFLADPNSTESEKSAGIVLLSINGTLACCAVVCAVVVVPFVRRLFTPIEVT